ncbi:MAG TPA: hypothetical protein VM802_19215 [Chitinophaga sp.]|uniref:immunoglobulin domain-containing protein n=1 Tax=Chitinophaga sp. TaxID=1869181 RepID=UPI002C03ABA0|nr:hypothetical protein [Chitinophaga sp.]HVI47016.1 hypothetical protein [Chitinophaga sp.]
MRFLLCNPTYPFIKKRRLPSGPHGSCTQILFFFFVLFFPFYIQAQTGCPQPQIRVYATQQRWDGFLGSVADEKNAADANPATASTFNLLGLLGLGSVRQYLSFSAPVPAGTTMFVKLTYPSSLFGVGNTVKVQPFVRKNGTETATGPAITVGNLISLLNGAGDLEVSVVARDASNNPVACDGVWIDFNSTLGLALKMQVYDAYYLKDATPPTGCNVPVDVFSGVRAGALALANALGWVTDPWKAIDNDSDTSTYAQLNTGAQILSEVFETILFNTASRPGDSLYIVMQNSVGGLLNLGLLSGFQVQPYLGTVAAGPPITTQSSVLNLRLLSGPGNKYVLVVRIPASFDRVDFQMGGLVDALSSLRIYDVSVKGPRPKPVLTINGLTGTGPICINDAGKLKLSLTPDPCTVYKWYDADKTTLLATGSSFSPVITKEGTYTWYVEAVRNSCNGDVRNRVPVTVIVLPKPGIPLLTIQLNP